MDVYLVISHGDIHAAFTDQMVAIQAAQATGDDMAYVQRLWVTK